MVSKLTKVLDGQGYELYEASVRQLAEDLTVFVARKENVKYVGIKGRDCQQGGVELAEGVVLHLPSWELYESLRDYPGLAPAPCADKASFGTGDRLGLVTAAHLAADAAYPVFPIVSQQSPRELVRTDRTFKSVLLDAFVGVLETGWTKGYGADADHIKDEKYLLEGVDAGYSMYTLDVSDFLNAVSDVSAQPEQLSDCSKKVIAQCKDKIISGHTFTEAELTKSAIVFESSMNQVCRFNDILKSKLQAFDLEVSIDEGSRDTSPEDHLYVVQYLHSSGISFSSLAPKFPGEFQKGIEYMGDRKALEQSMRVHGAIASEVGGYRLSLHSGSDKFSVYPLYAQVTGGNYHIKTSGTSWLEAVRLIASVDLPFFKELYSLCLENLMESKKAYHVYITPQHFPAEAPDNVMEFFDKDEVRQLFHISYGVLLDNYKEKIFDLLKSNEAKHYEFVSSHITRHLKLL